MTLQLDEANKLTKELSERKMELKAAMFNDNLASFDASLGHLTFANVQLPFKNLDFDSTELKLFYIDNEYYDFFLPLEQGKRIVAFKQFLDGDDVEKRCTQMCCFDDNSRTIATGFVKHHVEREHCVQSAPSEFVIFHYWESPTLSVYNSSLEHLGGIRCKNYSNICCNSKFVFGLWTMDDDDDDGDNNELEKAHQRIRVHHLDTLSEAFVLTVSKKYTIHRILADEHHLVAVSCLEGDPFGTLTQWFTSVFDLATCNEIGNGGETARFSLPERQIDFPTIWPSIADVFLLDGWLVVRGLNELVWFDKEGNRSETSTELDTPILQKMYASGSVLLLDVYQNALLIKRLPTTTTTQH